VPVKVDELIKSQGTAKKKVRDQGERTLRSVAYDQYAATTKDDAQRRYWAFYEAIRV